MKKKHEARTLVPVSLFFKFFVSILLNENKSEKEREEKKENKNHRRDGLPAEGYEGAGQGTFSPDTTSGGLTPGLSRVFLRKRF